MRPYKKQSDAEGDSGAPEWMVTFSDCMTLLLTFFVLMLSFSSFDESALFQLKIIFYKALTAVSAQERENKDGLLAPSKRVVPWESPYEGSERPTYNIGYKNRLKEDTGFSNFRRNKVFVIPSKELFWAKGTTISLQGRETLSTMASFLKEVPGRVIISENIPIDENNGNELGLSRAWGIMEYFTEKYGLDKKRFNISAASIIAQESSIAKESNVLQANAERFVEIVLLERSVYN